MFVLCSEMIEVTKINAHWNLQKTSSAFYWTNSCRYFLNPKWWQFWNIYRNVPIRSTLRLDNVLGVSIPWHFVYHRGAYSMILPHDCINNFGDKLSHTSNVISKPSSAELPTCTHFVYFVHKNGNIKLVHHIQTFVHIKWVSSFQLLTWITRFPKWILEYPHCFIIISGQDFSIFIQCK